MSTIMNKMMAKMQKLGRIRQLHTIISQETIRPSSPTPPHLKTFNLSLLDQFAPDMHTPVIFFYRNFYKNGDTNILKQSLSQTLTQYYPLAGRLPTPPAPYINCNDEGVEFLEASNDSPLDEFITKKEIDKTMDQLFPYGLSFSARESCPKLLEVQLNHFSGGGVAVALSISHKLADGTTIANFINHWATVTRCESPRNPIFVSSPASNNKTAAPELTVKEYTNKVKFTTRRFVFPNSKLNELKNKVFAMAMAMGTALPKLSRVEVLTSLIYKHAASAAATNSSGSLGPSNLSVAINIRNKFVEKYPETTAGNFITLAIVKMAGEIRLDEVINEMRKRKLEFAGIRDEQEAVEKLRNTFSKLHGDIYYSSSVCRVPFYEVDFGWGKPVEVTVRIPDLGEKGLMLMDTPSGHGIVALVRLPEEDIAILQNDKDFLTYVEDI